MKACAAVATALVLLAGPAKAQVFPSPAHLGDYSLGLGPALYLDRQGSAGPAVAAEVNLLLGSYTLGLHGLAGVDSGTAQGALGLEASVLGLIGAGFGYHSSGGLSIDGLLNVPLPLLPTPFFLGLSWRPSFLLHGGVTHEVALQLRWTSLLLPDD